jgi:sulfide:quinone oxidoreductase
MSATFDVVLLGVGAARRTVAAWLSNSLQPSHVTIAEPADKDREQRSWTLVCAGVFEEEVSARPTSNDVPQGATWIRDGVVSTT